MGLELYGKLHYNELEIIIDKGVKYDKSKVRHSRSA